MLAKTQDNEEIIERVAALDIGLQGHPRTRRLTSITKPPGSAALRRVLPRAQ